MKKKLPIYFFIFLISFMNGQERISDLTYRDGDISSHPGSFLEFNEKIIFAATSLGSGHEIWISNGKINEAYLLKDINPGKNNGIPFRLNESSVILNNTLFFLAEDGNSAGELWKTDGTPNGTQKVTDFLNYRISHLTLVGDKIYFLKTIANILQVWISDGTAAGTKIVKDNIPITNGPTFEGSINNTFLFTLPHIGGSNSKVWRSDGTDLGTFPITDEIDGNGGGRSGTNELTQYIEFNNELYFVSRYYLHKTDGTLENTEIVTALYQANNDNVNYADVTEVNGKLYFSFFQMNFNNFSRLIIWESDGTAIGSNQIHNKLSSSYFATSNLEKHENDLIFVGSNTLGTTSLNRMDLTDYSVTEIKEIQGVTTRPFIFDTFADICQLNPINENRFFCMIPLRSGGVKGWVSGLTAETTENIESLNSVVNIFNFGEMFYFNKRTDDVGGEFWRSDGTENNTILIDNINLGKYGMLDNDLSTVNNNLIFVANNGVIGNELWKYNGSSTTLLKDIYPGQYGSNSRLFTPNSDEIYFIAGDEAHGFEPWKTDGDELGTKMIQDLVAGQGTSYPQHLTMHKGLLYFVANVDNRYHLCSSDGENVEFITDFGVNSYDVPINVREMNSSDDYLYIITSASGGDLWKTDGTKDGTVKIKDFYSSRKLTSVGSQIFFTAFEAYQGEEELWVSNGTEIGTKLVKDIGTGYSSVPQELFSYNGLLYFTALTNTSGRELWFSDGTESGTNQLIEINSGYQSSIKSANFCILDNVLYFAANDGIHGNELWKTNGTAAQTALVKDINSGASGSFPTELVSLDGQLLFQAFDLDHGSELWKSDGTAVGTELVADILPGDIGSCPTNITTMNNDIYFLAESVDYGRQVWKTSLNSTVSLEDYSFDDKIIIFPNPTNGIINFDPDYLIENVIIYNTNGLLIRSEKTVDNKIDISPLTSGLYIAKFEINDQLYSRKIVKF